MGKALSGKASRASRKRTSNSHARRRKSAAAPSRPEGIVPERLYLLDDFYKLTGIGRTAVWSNRRDLGVELPTIETRKRKFILGSAIIDYIRDVDAAKRLTASQRAAS